MENPLRQSNLCVFFEEDLTKRLMNIFDALVDNFWYKRYSLFYLPVHYFCPLFLYNIRTTYSTILKGHIMSDIVLV